MGDQSFLTGSKIKEADSFTDIKNLLKDKGYNPAEDTRRGLGDLMTGRSLEEVANYKFYHRAKEDLWSNARDPWYGHRGEVDLEELPGYDVDINNENTVHVRGHPHSIPVANPSEEIIDVLKDSVQTYADKGELFIEEYLLTNEIEPVYERDSVEELNDIKWAYNQSSRGWMRFIGGIISKNIPNLKLNVAGHDLNIVGGPDKEAGEAAEGFQNALESGFESMEECQNLLNAHEAFYLPLEAEREFQRKYKPLENLLMVERSIYQVEESIRRADESTDDVYLLTGFTHSTLARDALKSISESGKFETSPLN